MITTLHHHHVAVASSGISGALILGIVGAVIVFGTLVVNVVVVRADSPRYRLGAINAYDGGAKVERIVQDMSLITTFLAIGAALQLVALIWQAS